MTSVKERKYECTSCKEKFFTQHFMQSHVQRVHKDIRQYHCEVCGQHFKLFSTLSVHKDIAHRSNKKCDSDTTTTTTDKGLEKLSTTSEGNSATSSQSYGTNSDDNGDDTENSDKLIMESTFSKHIDGVKYWICKFCSSAKLQLPLMIPHVAKHLGMTERKHKCSECEKKFKTAKCLEKHILMHNDTVRPFKCKYCQMTFRLHLQFNQHINKHVGDIRCCCLQCGRFTDNLAHLKTHILKAHAF
ncbi:zinc finger protein 724 isoform X2 [Octopus bimaculoides]|uniref:C2H2-type domain-containing protein n=2 Tax=Octopus bimaculoides TaxID=37653 RepID=A0A0L8G4E2_OCTBM|nr:zinc finger protein 724 isoform X2 [Octopus bimaculoides]XP_052834145.1 zinc finger protein 724 isoform X2 [Octopus bimaculoides]|eukprot:XP_014784158.1 PREDICTED: putative zinc finger protein 724 isoform X2 [Octopus bimaculoides]